MVLDGECDVVSYLSEVSFEDEGEWFAIVDMDRDGVGFLYSLHVSSLGRGEHIFISPSFYADVIGVLNLNLLQVSLSAFSLCVILQVFLWDTACPHTKS